MNFTTTPKLTNTAILQLISDAREAELNRDLIRHQEILKPIWEELDLEPNFSDYNNFQKAELYRLCGYFISFYGKSKNIRYFQERAKNLLTNSVELFSELQLKDQAAEARIILALCYFYEGAMLESETILSEIKNEYLDDNLHPVYLKSCVNRLVLLHWKSEFQTALEIIREIEIPVEFCNDSRLSYMFHIQAGMIYRGIQNHEAAIYHYNKSITTAQALNNWVTVAMNHNNLAFLYKNQKNFDAAHYQIEVSLKIFRDLKQNGWLPHILDTKALIYFSENKFSQALETIDEAIALLKDGEDYAVLVDAMWNKVRCLLALNQKEDAILLFAQLAQTAQINIGEVAVKKYSKLFTDIIYVKQDDSLESEVTRFKKTEIVNALRQMDYNFEDAAIELGYATANKLIKVLNNEFPELYEELGIQPRTKQPKVKNIKNVARGNDEKNSEPASKLINQLHLRNVHLEFDAELNIRISNNIKTFYCSPEKMSEVFDISFDAVLAVAPLNQTNDNQYVLIRKFENNDYQIVRLTYDKDLEISILMDKDIPLTFDEVEIIGKAVGYCSFEEADSEKLFFKPLSQF